MNSHLWKSGRDRTRGVRFVNRRGAFLVLAFFTLVVVLGIVALSVDLGVVSLTKSRMQNAVDAAALAAAQEITAALESVSDETGDGGNVSGQVADANSIAEQASREMAEKVAMLNGVYVDPQVDVRFGKRVYNANSAQFDILWDVSPYNVVKVTARRNTDNVDDPDGKLKLFFAAAMGEETVSITASAIAFVEARDIVVVLDYSGSMSYDSQFRGMDTLGKSAVEANLDAIWNKLVADNPKFTGTTTSKFPSTGLGLINSYAGTTVTSTNVDTVLSTLKLNETSGGKPKYPFPQEGKNSNGSMKGMPSTTTSNNLWKNYISWVLSDSDVNQYNYKKKYGYRTLAGYLLSQRPNNDESEDLWRTPHYPFEAMKNGMTLFTEFLDGLEFGDHVGLVTYDSTARVESELNEADVPEQVDLGDELITDDYDSVNVIQRHKQAGHYDVYTAIGDGIKEAKQLLDEHGRYGARPTILIMTDGNANRYPSGWQLPGGWSWADYTDTDGDGDSDYSTSDKNKQYAFYQAKLAIDAGYTIHTLSVGAEADTGLMQAIAFAGAGTWFNVPGGSTVAEMEDQMLEAFSKIAANVPPPKLLHDPDQE